MLKAIDVIYPFPSYVMLHAIVALVSAHAQTVEKVIPEGLMNKAPFVFDMVIVKISVLVITDPGVNPKVTIP